MDVFEAVTERRSIRAYVDRPVEREKLERILEAGRLAPSAMNVEPWHFIVVTDPAKRKALSAGSSAKFVADSPVVIVACGDFKASPDWYAMDVAFAVENMVLTAVGEGLGTCCVDDFSQKGVRTLLKVPANFEILLLIAIGYPTEQVDLSNKLLNIERARKTLSEVSSEEEFGKRLLLKKMSEL